MKTDQRYITARDPDSPHYFARVLLRANESGLHKLTGLLLEHRELTAEQIRDSITLAPRC